MIITRRRRRILELIATRPRGVVDLAQAGGFWRGPLYGLLRRFEDRGLLTSRLLPRPRLPDYPRRVYSITDAGREAIQ